MAMRTLIPVLLLFSGALTAEAAQVDEPSAQTVRRADAPDERTDPRGTIVSDQTLADVGYPDGISLDRPNETARVYLRSAPGVPVSDGLLHLDLSSAIQNFRFAFVEILVNGIPRRSIDLTSGDTTNFAVDIPLDQRDLDRPGIAVSIRYGGRLRDDMCFDPRMNGSFVRVHGSSGLRFRYRPTSVSTIAGAWGLLPKAVTVGLPSGTLSPSIYQAAWQMGTILSRAGHDVQFVKIPDAQELQRAAGSPTPLGRDQPTRPGEAEGESVATDSLSQPSLRVGSSRELASWLLHGEPGGPGREGERLGLILVADDSVAQRLNTDLRSAQQGIGRSGQTMRQLDPVGGAAAGQAQAGQGTQAQSTAAADSDNLRLRRIGGQPVILVGQQIPARAARFLAEPWRQVAQTTDLEVTEANPRRDGEHGEGTITFRDLGIDSPVTDVSERGEWSFPFSVRDFSPGRLPSRAILKVYMGRSTVKEPGVMNVYLNGTLIHSQRVGGTPEEVLEMDLPKGVLHIDNNLRVELQRQLWSNAPAELTGECRALPPPIPVQFSESSRIESKRVRSVSEFLDLPASMGKGFRAFVPASALSAPEVSLPILSRLGADILPMAALRDVHFYQPGEQLEAGKHFLVMGDARGFGLRAPTEVQDSTVTMFDRRRRPQMAFTGEPDVTLLQIARAEGGTGLWVRPLHEPPYAVPKAIYLSRGDVAFLGEQGVDVTFDSREAQRERRRQLAELAESFRYILVGLAAVLLGILLVLWLRRRRTRGSMREADEEARPTGRAA